MDLNLIFVIIIVLYTVYLYKQNVNLYIENKNLQTYSVKQSDYNTKVMQELNRVVDILQEREEQKEMFVDVIDFNSETLLKEKAASELSNIKLTQSKPESDRLDLVDIPSEYDPLYEK